MMHRLSRSILLIAAAFVTVPHGLPAAQGQNQADSTGKALFCAHGSVEFTPIPRPPGFESQFAVAVVSIRSPHPVQHAAVTDFTLFDPHGNATLMKRVVSVETVDVQQVPVASNGSFAHYLDSPGTPWDGSLPAGVIELRIRVALRNPPIAPVRFRLRVGSVVVQGPVDGAWAT